MLVEVTPLKAMSHEAIFSCNLQLCVASCKKKLPRVTWPLNHIVQDKEHVVRNIGR